MKNYLHCSLCIVHCSFFIAHSSLIINFTVLTRPLKKLSIFISTPLFLLLVARPSSLVFRPYNLQNLRLKGADFLKKGLIGFQAKRVGHCDEHVIIQPVWPAKAPPPLCGCQAEDFPDLPVAGQYLYLAPVVEYLGEVYEFFVSASVLSRLFATAQVNCLISSWSSICSLYSRVTGNGFLSSPPKPSHFSSR